MKHIIQFYNVKDKEDLLNYFYTKDIYRLIEVRYHVDGNFLVFVRISDIIEDEPTIEEKINALLEGGQKLIDLKATIARINKNRLK